jgi:hypothetical protein
MPQRGKGAKQATMMTTTMTKMISTTTMTRLPPTTKI